MAVQTAARAKIATRAANPQYVLGVDLGQVNDPTAVALIEHSFGRQPLLQVRPPAALPTRHELPGDQRSDRRPSQRLTAPRPHQRRRRRDRCRQTRRGRPQAEARSNRFYAITITGGNSVTASPGNTNVPKRDLISTCQLLLQNGRLKIAAGIPDAAALIDEMLAYRITISENGHDSYGPWRERDHDDLLLALALAAWTAQNRSWRPASFSKPKGRLPLFSGRTYHAMNRPSGWPGF